jgi:hypothetical protein
VSNLHLNFLRHYHQAFTGLTSKSKFNFWPLWGRPPPPPDVSDFADYAAILDTAGEAVRARLQDPAGTFTLVASADEGFNARPTGELPFVLSDATVAVDAANYNIADTKYTIAELKAAVAAGEYDLGNMVATVRDDILFIDEHEVIGEVRPISIPLARCSLACFACDRGVDNKEKIWSLMLTFRHQIGSSNI